MKKFLAIGIVLAVLISALFASGALAASPATNVSVSWVGTGTVGGAVTLGDDQASSFTTAGNFVAGNYSTGYVSGGSDKTTSSINAFTADGGATSYVAGSSSSGYVATSTGSFGVTWTHDTTTTKSDNVNTASVCVGGIGPGTTASLTAYVGSNSANVSGTVDGKLKIKAYLGSGS